MPQRTDLYTVLNSYARKINSPLIEMDGFIDFLEKYSKRICEEKPEWNKWTEQTGTKVWMDMNQLSDEGRVLIQSNNEKNSVYLSHYFLELVKEAYRDPDKESSVPFPDETSLNLEIPNEQILPLYLSVDLTHFLETPQKEMLPIIRLVFPNEKGSAIIPGFMIPIDLLKFSIAKIREYLGRLGRKEYIQQKLTPQLIGKEDYLRDILDKIMIRPYDILNDIKEGRENAYAFWAHFCNFVKTDLGQKKELLSEELGALQSTFIVEICSSFFKARAAKAKEIELALRNFELELEKPPFYFSREAISKFKDNKGVPLLGIYTQDELDAYIEKRTTEPAASNELPDLLYFYTEDHKSWLVKKTKLMILCSRLLTETRQVIIKAISKRWKKMLGEFVREKAMDDDNEFERLVSSSTGEYAPLLKTLLKDKRFYLVHEELSAASKGGLPESSRFFKGNELLPMHILLLLKRKQLVSNVKLSLPFWYTMPILSSIIAFFSNLKKKKKINREAEKKQNVTDSEDPLEKWQNVAEEIAAKIVPSKSDMDTYLDNLSSRWGNLINKQAKQNLVEDVNSLVRDKLRQIMRIHKNSAINSDTLDKFANSIMDSSKGLLKITEQNALFLYIKLYISKLLIDRTL